MELDEFSKRLFIDNGFDTDDKIALRNEVLAKVYADGRLWAELWPLTDAYGVEGFIPPQGFDWSGFRDSTYAAILKMSAKIAEVR